MIRKVIGKMLYSLIGTHLPSAHCRVKFIGKFSKWFRALCGRMMLAKCGNNVNIYPGGGFSSKVELGNNSDLGLRCRINGKVIIGDDVIMAPDVAIYTVNHNTERIDVPIKYQGITEERPVIIGDGTWICSRVIILPGVKIGKGVVVGAGAVITKDIPDFAVVAGNPAKIVRIREQKIEEK